jgi:C-terminal processing protease CtpA/Prc
LVLRTLGLIVTDNGAGKVFIKSIKEDSIASRAQPALQIGDHIEKVDDQSVVGKRHVQVCQIIAAIQPGKR